MNSKEDDQQLSDTRMFNNDYSKQEEITNGNSKCRAERVKPNSRADVVTNAAPPPPLHLPEENLEILKDPLSPGKQRNWSDIHSSPANTIVIANKG